MTRYLHVGPADGAEDVGEGRERYGLPVSQPHHGCLALRGFLDQGQDAAVPGTLLRPLRAQVTKRRRAVPARHETLERGGEDPSRPDRPA